MNSKTLARKRALGELPYKTPPTDGRRLRWAVPRIPLTPEQFQAVEAAMKALFHEALAIFYRAAKVVMLAAPLALGAGCAHFKVEQADVSPQRSITTSISGVSIFSSAQTIARLKATQTDRTQSFGADSVSQQTTNVAASLEALTRLIQSLR